MGDISVKPTKEELTKVYLCLSSIALDKKIEALEYELKNNIINPKENEYCIKLRKVSDYYNTLAEKFIIK